MSAGTTKPGRESSAGAEALEIELEGETLTAIGIAISIITVWPIAVAAVAPIAVVPIVAIFMTAALIVAVLMTAAPIVPLLLHWLNDTSVCFTVVDGGCRHCRSGLWRRKDERGDTSRNDGGETSLHNRFSNTNYRLMK